MYKRQVCAFASVFSQGERVKEDVIVMHNDQRASAGPILGQQELAINWDNFVAGKTDKLNITGE